MAKAPVPAKPEPAATPEMSEDQALAWLEGLAAKQGAAPEELVSKPETRGEDMPAWVQHEAEVAEADAAEAEAAYAEVEPVEEESVEVEAVAVETTETDESETVTETAAEPLAEKP